MTPAGNSAQGTESVARIGPNAIIRMAEALRPEIGAEGTAHLFESAGLAHYLADPPEHMVDEREVIALHRAVRGELGLDRSAGVAREAGRLTGDYVLAHRIPKPAQFVLRLLPRPLAGRALLAAIGRNAWTFVGSGVFSAEPGPVVRITIANCPLCRDEQASRPICDYYAATFERLFRKLVARDTLAREIACQAQGDPACVFELTRP